MKQRNLLWILSILAMTTLLLTGCDSKQEKPEVEYQSSDKSYGIQVPKSWKKSSEQVDAAISVESSDSELKIIVQQFSKRVVSAIITNKEQFIEYYHQNVTAGFGTAKEVTDNPSFTGSSLIQAEEYELTQDGKTEKVYISYLETDYAYYVIIAGGAEKKYKKEFDVLKSCIATFREDAEVVASLVPEISDTLLWFNGTYGLLTVENKADIRLVGGYENSAFIQETIRQGLELNWGVTDRASADENLKWLLEEGHNSDLLELYNTCEMDSYTRDELVQEMADSDITGIDAVTMLVAYDAVQKYGENAILGWDLARAIQVCAWYYLAGYYTYEEAMDQSLEIAKTLQSSFQSWDEMIDSYLLGFQYWNQEDSSDETSKSYKRRQSYEQLKTEKDSPYQLDWNLTFTKDW